jgi:phosphoenolpyruvate carboxykinase (diphosphate)
MGSLHSTEKNLSTALGLPPSEACYPDARLIDYINLKLAAMSLPTVAVPGGSEFHKLAAALLLHHRESQRLLSDYLCPADQRIQDFLCRYSGSEAARIPAETLVLDRHGIARALSLPPDRDDFISQVVSSYRVRQGVLHNPKSDRRTTQGIFHIAEGGLPVPDDKLAVPKQVFGEMLRRALAPPPDIMRLPFTSNQEGQAECFVSLLLRPTVCPAVAGVAPHKSMEIRFFAPGNLVSNLDFVESIFGNAGDPFLPENDAGLDVHHWTGHTGCVILAPHLPKVTKKEAGLPHRSQATPRQQRDGMCWETEDELYNNGTAFKLACRDETGVMVTIIADSYFGYCKKEVKTQLSFSANLFGDCEEEHAGGALVFPSYDLGEEYLAPVHTTRPEHRFPEVLSMFGGIMDLQPEGYGIDKKFPDILYVPEDSRFDQRKLMVSWSHNGAEQQIRMLPNKTYIRPSGYRVQMEKPPGGRAWRLVGTVADGTLCHKPCTVSGGGKSEISKPITDAILQGPIFVADFKKDFDLVSELIGRDYAGRFREARAKSDSRPILSPARSLGSVIKLLTPSSRDYTDDYNAFLESIPQYIKELVFVVKRFYKAEWDGRWREHFSVDIINGVPGNELKLHNRKLITTYLRVGFEQDGSWRTFGLRKDFHPAAKWALEDDITASVVIPAEALPHRDEKIDRPTVKFVFNCESRLFQRPDDAVHRGYDRLTEADFAKPGNFFSNYEPLEREAAHNLIQDTIGFEQFTAPMQELIRQVAGSTSPSYFVCTAFPRLVDGKPSKNPRYLQLNPNLANPQTGYLAEMSARLQRRIPLEQPVFHPVNAVLPGRRNNPPDHAAGIRSLAVYNPIHYMELPELFMEFICSMTGKSPSTTGAGSEGALTKGPFNALLPIIDLNNALVAYLLTGYSGFVSAAGYVGPCYRVDHDISLLIPEIWCRMSAEERDPGYLIQNHYLERCEDLEHEGKKVLSSRLGYRITRRFVRAFFGRIFNHPHVVFTDEMLQPERQDLAIFAEGMENIIQTQKRVAEHYFKDESIQLACPPLRALLHIMRDGRYESMELSSPDFRSLFTRPSLLASDWYAERLRAKQQIELALWKRHVDYLQAFLGRQTHAQEAERLGIRKRLAEAKSRLAHVESGAYPEELKGTLGAHPPDQLYPE